MGAPHFNEVGTAGDLPTLLLRAVEVWFLISVVEVIHGVARVALLQPLVGDFRARQIAVFTGSVLILVIAFIFRRWIRASSAPERLVVGAVWVLLTIGFEILLGRIVMNLTWERILSDYDLTIGGLMPIGFLVMLFAPILISRLMR